MAKTGLRYVPYQERHPLIRWAFENNQPIKALSAGLGVSRVAIHHWDAGRFRPSGHTLSQIIKLTGGAVTADQCHDYWLSKQKEIAA